MNKIILLGHPSSSFGAVENLLKQSGMKTALPSKRDNLLPEAITDTLCKAHDCVLLDDVMSEDEFQPQQVGTVWHGLALDLLLGNLDQELWGWADSRSIFWLDYWSSLDPHATFVMVYDHPISVLQSNASLLANGDLEMAVPRLLENWQAYNGAMLRFYSQQPDRCLLVNSQGAKEQLDNYLVELGDRLGAKNSANLYLPADFKQDQEKIQEQAQEKNLEKVQEQSHGIESLLSSNQKFNADIVGKPSSLMAAINNTALSNKSELINWFGGDSAFDQHLLLQLLSNYPQATQIFEELEAASTVSSNSENEKNNIHPGQAWVQFIQQRQAIADVVIHFYEQLQKQITEIEKLEQEKKEFNDKLLDLDRVKQSAEETHKVKDLEEENDLLLTQLHTVQEELERYYLENQELIKKQPKPKPKHYGAAERVQQQLSYRLGAAMIANSRSLGGCLKMPFSLIGVARAYHADLRAKANLKLPPIHAYADAHDAERYRQHLSFQLGQTMLKHIKTPWGWLWMPFALAGTAKAFKKSRT
jgi:type II secretory pathway component PulJ